MLYPLISLIDHVTAIFERHFEMAFLFSDLWLLYTSITTILVEVSYKKTPTGKYESTGTFFFNPRSSGPPPAQTGVKSKKGTLICYMPWI